MKTKSFISLLLSTLTVLSLGCNNPSDGSDSSSNVKIEAPSDFSVKSLIETGVIESVNDFGFNLYNSLLSKKSSESIFISPPSISFSLAMAYNGAYEDTKDQIARNLGVLNISKKDANEAFNTYIRMLLTTKSDTKLEIANSIWANKEVKFKDDFLSDVEKSFFAKISSLDFSEESTVEEINQWVKDSTNNKIESIVDSISSDSIMFLINAIYFKGQWTDKFDKSRTKDMDFTRLNGVSKKHPMMNQFGKFDYYEDDDFQAISLPYGKDKRFSMYVLLPSEESSLADLQENLNINNWNKWIKSFRSKDGEITLPRFKLVYEETINDALKDNGITDAFDGAKANFDNLSDLGNTKISQVKHKTFLDVNEEGTEAAAVTSTEIVATSIQLPQEPFKMLVNRPYFIVIRDNETKAILFMGSISEPK